MYLSARHLNIKLKQDSTNFICDEDCKALILCDGIGEFSQSQIVSAKVADVMIEKRFDDINKLIQDSEIIALKDKIENGGTTVIFAILKSNEKVKIQYLGNGGCIKLNGDFNQSSQGLVPYKYNHLLNPFKFLINQISILLPFLLLIYFLIKKIKIKLPFDNQKFILLLFSFILNINPCII